MPSAQPTHCSGWSGPCMTCWTNSWLRPRNRSASVTRPCGESNSYVFSTLHPGQGAPLFRQRIAPAREGLFLGQQLLAFGDPLFTVTTRCMGGSFSVGAP